MNNNNIQYKKSIKSVPNHYCIYRETHDNNNDMLYYDIWTSNDPEWKPSLHAFDAFCEFSDYYDDSILISEIEVLNIINNHNNKNIDNISNQVAG